MQNVFLPEEDKRHPPATAASPKGRRGTKKNMSLSPSHQQGPSQTGCHKQKERGMRLVGHFLLDPISRKGASTHHCNVPHASILSRVIDISPGDTSLCSPPEQSQVQTSVFVHNEQCFHGGWVFPDCCVIHQHSRILRERASLSCDLEGPFPVVVVSALLFLHGHSSRIWAPDATVVLPR